MLLARCHSIQPGFLFISALCWILVPPNILSNGWIISSPKLVPLPAQRYFQPERLRGPTASAATRNDPAEGRPTTNELAEANDAELKEMTDERKAVLFQFLLRDLQVEGVPLLEVDVDQSYTLQSALWTIMAQLSEEPSAQKVCLVMEAMPISTLRGLVNHWNQPLKSSTTIPHLADHFPELQRFSLSLVGKGVGPAILMETTEVIHEPPSCYPDVMIEDDQYVKAMQQFVDRMKGQFTQQSPTASWSAKYWTCSLTNVCNLMAGFWNIICEMQLTSDSSSTTAAEDLPQDFYFLMWPHLGSSPSDFHRFEAWSALLNQSLGLYPTELAFELRFFHPAYDRDSIRLDESLAGGHLPPFAQWPSILEPQSVMRASGGSDAGDSGRTFSDAELHLLNYLRRSPVPAVSIRRLVPGEEAKGTLDAELDSSLLSLMDMLAQVMEQGEVNLQKSQEEEMAILRSSSFG